MTAQDYIISTVKALKTPIQMESIGSTPLEDAIYAKVMSKKISQVKTR
jgi:hypothetical protein